MNGLYVGPEKGVVAAKMVNLKLYEKLMRTKTRLGG